MMKGSPGKDSETIQLEPMSRASRQNESVDLTETDAKVPLRNATRKTCDSGDSSAGLHRRNFYERANEVVRCSERKTYCVLCVCCLVLLITSLIIALAPLRNGCTCSEDELSKSIDDEKDAMPRMENGELFPWDNIRLPSFAHPTRYNITMHPNLTTLDFRGRVTIEFYVDEETKFIVFHSKNLTIKEQIVKEGYEELKIAKLLEYPKREQLYLELEEKFRRKQNYTLFLSFNSTLNNTELKGFYFSTYVTPDGDQKYLATTLFEPTYARMAFPCFDEPQFKAKFKISIYRDRFHISLCNMPIVNTEEAGFYLGTNLLRDDFQESVEMSTYLVAFVVCDFNRYFELTERNTSVSVYAPAHMLPQTNYSLTTAVNIMNYFESFFGIPYPLPKQDLIAIPDFAPAAMENWGLIAFREIYLMYDPIETSTEIQEYVAVLMAHELAHQWFGNLVTMKWWNDIWLNEGAATFFEYKGVNHISPEWGMMNLFILHKTQRALELDALANSHPISVPVANPMEIESIFDTVSYFKGASILYMLEGVLCESVFKRGLNDYLNSHAYGNTETNDLWSVFTKHTKNSSLVNELDIKTIMNTWTQQTGFPLVTIIRDGETVTATQKRFLLSPREKGANISQSKSPFNYKWYIPLNCYTHEPPGNIEVWMNMTNATFEISTDVEYIKCNVNQTGFYRVNYPNEMWVSIIKTLKSNHTKFSSADRANLVDDVFSLCDAGELDASIPLDLALYLINERDHAPWETALRYLNLWKKRLGESEAYKRYIIFFKKLLNPITKYVGWKDEGTHLKKLLRTTVLKSAIELEMTEVVKPAKNLFQDWISKNKRIAPDIRNIVYMAGVKFGEETEWLHCWNVYLKTQIQSEKLVMLQALGAAMDPWLLKRYLRFSLNRDLIKAQDVNTVIASVAANTHGHYLAWRHIKAYWPQIEILYMNESLSISDLILSVVPDYFITEYDYSEVSEFFKQHDLRSGDRTLQQSLEIVKFNIHWVKINAKSVNDWLVKYFTLNTSKNDTS
ncbi:endoplasmic reticulum aminopeptidase 1-like isoform X2 [Linepithema humile]|uniref:endoplasmic reticulum aminopeptidase 1-like isoform X2 n=1 Tax=Linepithema humile TaxID=83485 RepID=UPI0006239293|nr:PREDICTED: endoplasmic reticulum aminopeptidase 1-like isoform X1 [Linepithema humile]XP_012221596.1 PREDICTED: endoplasmic reticulum aminopeptidase 1-like isoform X1 [Linepithema humile]